MDDAFDRNDDRNEVFSGACDGLDSVEWNGGNVLASVAPNKAVDGVAHLTLRQFGANGKVRVR